MTLKKKCRVADNKRNLKGNKQINDAEQISTLHAKLFFRSKGYGEYIARCIESHHVKVEDISGGCGSMYRVEVESPMFAGVPLVKQHRMVNEVLKSEITEMHGLTISTRAPPKK